MSIEETRASFEVNLDSFVDSAMLSKEVASLEKRETAVVTVNASVESWDKLREIMPALRSANISPILCLKRGEEKLDPEALHAVFQFLKLWDQFTLHNFLELCGDSLPPGAVSILQPEAKMELKWFKEWSTAATDSRINKYPGLPWRRFIRKTNTENELFVTKFLELLERTPRSEETVVELKALMKAFLDEKKKVVNIFPKKFKGNA